MDIVTGIQVMGQRYLIEIYIVSDIQVMRQMFLFQTNIETYI